MLYVISQVFNIELLDYTIVSLKLSISIEVVVAFVVGNKCVIYHSAVLVLSISGYFLIFKKISFKENKIIPPHCIIVR